MATFLLFAALGGTAAQHAIMVGIHTRVHHHFYAHLLGQAHHRDSLYFCTGDVGIGESCPCLQDDCSCLSKMCPAVSLLCFLSTGLLHSDLQPCTHPGLFFYHGSYAYPVLLRSCVRMATFRIFSLARTLGRETIMAGIRTLVHRRFYAPLVDYLYLQSCPYPCTRTVGNGESCHRLDC